MSDRDDIHVTAGPVAAACLQEGLGLAREQILALLRRIDVDIGRLQTVQFDRHNGHEIVGAGVLHPSAFAQHPPAVRLGGASAEEALSVWAAVTASRPDELLSFLDRSSSGLPLLRRSLFSLLYHYPDVRTGLNAWEHQLLLYVRDVEPQARRAIGYTMGHDMAFPEWMGDSYLFERLHRHANRTLARPLVVLGGDTRNLRGAEVRLTEHGEAILAGRGNAVAWNGIDDWVGGVHLDSRRDSVWFRKGRTLIAHA